MPRYGVARIGLRWLLAAVGWVSFAADGSASLAANLPISFSAIGDAPYGDAEVPLFQSHLDNHNLYSTSDFFVHLGDIFSDDETCEEFRYQRMADMLHTLAVPAYVVPGDNEIADCSLPGQAWQWWTQYFMHFEEFYCGTPLTEHPSVRPENFAFVKNGVLFVGIDLVGGGNDTQIMQDDAGWVSQQLAAKKPSVRAAVILAQAGPGSNRSVFFDPFVLAAAAFGKPILYLHGDGHIWVEDRPFPGAQNVLRVQVDRGSLPPVQVTVTLDTTNPFQFSRDPWPAGTPLYNRPPCANAGPDQSIAHGQSATLAGQASDNAVPNNPPQLTPTWSQVGGPGTVTFTDPTGLVTQASFSASGVYPIRLSVSDGALTTTDDLTVYVADSASDLPPTAANDSTETERDWPLATGAPGVLANDSDPEGAVLTAVLATPPQHGDVDLGSDGSFTYTPAAGYVGTDTFTYRASDGLMASNLATVTIRVGIRFAAFTPIADARVKNTTPTSNSGTSATLRIEQSSTIQHSYLKFALTGLGPVRSATLRLHVEDGSLDGGRVHAVANEYLGTTTPWAEKGINWNNAPALTSPVLDSAGAVSAGTWVELDVTAAVPGNGTFSFGMDGTSGDAVHYYAKEGANPPQLVVVYLFGSAADARPVASDDAHALQEDATLTVAAPGVLGNDTDPDGDALTATLASPPASGSLALQPTGGFTYIPSANFSGEDWFTYTVSDGRGGTDIGSVHLVVDPLPDPPLAANDAYTLVVGDSLVAAAPGVLGNDADPDGEPLFATLVTPAAHGNVVLAADGAFTYQPAPAFVGTDGFTYHVQDPGGLGANATVTLQVTPPPPVAFTFAPVADAHVNSAKPRTNYGTASDLQLRESTTDYKTYLRFAVSSVTGSVQSAKLRLFVTDGGPDGGSIYTVSNNTLGTSTPWTETGISWNNAPAISGTPLAFAGAVTVGSWVELNVTASIFGDGTTCYGVQSLNSNTVKYASRETPNAPQLVLLVQQGGSAGNHAPAPGNDSYSLNEDGVLALPAPGVLANDTDPDGDPLAAGGVIGPAHGTLDLHADGSFTYTPQANYNGADSFTYTASDGRGGAVAATVGLTVNAVNDAPVATADSWSATAGQTLAVPAPGVLANDTDVEGTALAAVLVTGVAHGTLALGSNGSFTYTPVAGFTGTDSFTYRASDGSAQSSDAAVTLTIGNGTITRLPVVFEEMVGGGSTGAATVTTAGAMSAVPGHLYVAAIATKSSTAVIAVSGLGLTWTRVRNQCGGRGQTVVEVWVGRGTPSAGSVTATLQSAPTNAVLLVARYSGADPANPIGHIVSGNTLGTNGVCSGGTDNSSFSFDLTTGEGSLVLGAVASRSKTLTPGAGGVKRGQIFQGTDTGTMATVSIMDKTATGASSVVDGTFSGSVDWAVIGVEILPQVLVTKTAVAAAAPHTTVLHIFPNPFTRGTWIEYDLPSPTRVEATVYNARGQRVRTLAAGRQVPGRWRLYWDGRNEQGTGVAAGIYFLRAQIGDVLHTRKVVLQR